MKITAIFDAISNEASSLVDLGWHLAIGIVVWLYGILLWVFYQLPRRGGASFLDWYGDLQPIHGIAVATLLLSLLLFAGAATLYYLALPLMGLFIVVGTTYRSRRAQHYIRKSIQIINPF